MTPPSKSRPAVKLVPVEPTEEMKEACILVIGQEHHTRFSYALAAYSAMLAAAPEVGGVGDGSSCAPADVVAGQGTTALASGWRRMDSAPRDGTPFMAYNPFLGIYHTAYVTRWTGEPHETGYEGFPCGFHASGPDSYPFGKWDCVPCAWHPLPEPPAYPLSMHESLLAEREAAVPRAAATPQPAQAEPLDR